MPFLLANWRVLILGTIVLLLGIQTWRLDRCQTQFEEFRISTEALGRAQKAKNAAIAEANEHINQEVVRAKNEAIVGLSEKYDRARRELAAARRLRNNPSGGGVPRAPAAPDLASACEPADRPASGLGINQAPPVAEVATNVARLAAVEAALLDALERADREMIKYRQLWRWASGIK